MTTTLEALLSADEFRLMPDDGRRLELVKGKVIELPIPTPKHGYICGNVVGILTAHVIPLGLGRVVSNDSGIITERSPDTVRGGDVAFYSFARVPRGPLPIGYLDVMPELVFEVLSPTDRWRIVLAKVGEYLKAEVNVVCVVDPDRETIHVFSADHPALILSADQELTLPDLLGEFRASVRSFFE
jgi:Uma2 family endonuclease